MDGFAVFVTFIWNLMILAGSNKCEVVNKVLNRTGLMLTDCPLADASVTDLVLHDNHLMDLTTSNCQNWVHLSSLTISRNKVQVVPNFLTFTKLKVLNLSNNIICNVTISSQSLVELNISHNAIVDVAGSKFDNLTIFIAGHNKIDTASMGRIFEMLKNCPSIQIVDVSYNLIDSLPNQMRSFRPQHLSYINLAGNKLRVIDLGLFNCDIGQDYHVDLSNNFITKLSIRGVRYINVRYLNLSNNKLSMIDGQMMRNFVGLERIDLFNNPLNCLCNESASFMEWMFGNLIKVARPSKLMCSVPVGKLLFNTSCRHWFSPLAIVTPPISLIASRTSKNHKDRISASTRNFHASRDRESPVIKSNHSASSSTRPDHSSSDPASPINKSSNTALFPTQAFVNMELQSAVDKLWKLAVGIIILIAVCITLVMLICLCHRRRRRYHILTDNDTSESTHHCLAYLPFQSSNEIITETHATEEEHLHVL